MYAEFTQDESLREDAIIMDQVSRPLESHFNASIKEQSGGMKQMIDWACNRCTGAQKSWWFAVDEVLNIGGTSDLLMELGISMRCSSHVQMQPFLQPEMNVLQRLLRFARALASRFAWSQMVYKYTLPHALGFMLSNRREVRLEGMAHLKTMVEAVVSAQDAVLRSPDALLVELLDDLAWDEEALCIEVMALLLQSDFDPDNLELRILARRYWAGSCTTALILEKCFAWLNNVFNCYTGIRNKTLGVVVSFICCFVVKLA